MKVKNSLTNLSLKRRVYISIALISLLPAIVLFYHFSGYYISFWTALILFVVISLGWGVVSEVFFTIAKMHAHSRNALKDIGEKVPSVPDEVQSLEKMIDLLSNKVKSSLEQVKGFTQMTEDLNKEVSRTVLVLSTVLQANDLLSKEASAGEAIKLIINRLKNLMRIEACFCGLENKNSKDFETIVCQDTDSPRIENFFKEKGKELSRVKETIVVDSRNKSKSSSLWAQELDMKNVVIVPVVAKERVIGVIGMGNNENKFSFSKNDLELLNLFSQNITLIWQYEKVSAKAEELEIIDYLTGLYNEKLIRKRLDEEIKRSTLYQRPCGFIAAQIVNYGDYQEKHGLIEAERVLKEIAKIFKNTLRPIDIAGRIGDDTLGAILMESNKRQSQEVANKLKKSLKQLCESNIKLNFSVAESPIHGVTAKELISFVRGGNKI